MNRLSNRLSNRVKIGLLFLCFIFHPFATEAAAKKTTYFDVHYGKHEMQIFDLWLPKSKKPAPLVIYIHGGGFASGSKDEIRKNPSIANRFTSAGIAFAAINYRFLKHTALQNIMREDIAGFVQFMRYHAKHYRLNPDQVFPYGVSAGGSASLWLASHDDIADPSSSDPMKRLSSRVTAAGHFNAQVSYDYTVWYEFFGKELTDKFMGDQVWTRYHFAHYEDIFTEEGQRVRKDLDMYGNLSSDDCPILFYNSLEEQSEPDSNHFIHSPKHTRLLAEHARSVGIKTESFVKADGDKVSDTHKTAFDFFTGILKTL